MSRKRNHRMQHRPALPTMFAQVMADQRTATPEQAVVMAARMGVAVEAITRGHADSADWGTVVDVVNMVEALIALGLMDGQAEVLRLMGVLAVVLERRAGQGTHALYASELADVRSLSGVWAEAVQALPLGALRRAEQMVLARQARMLAQLRRSRVAGAHGRVVVA